MLKGDLKKKGTICHVLIWEESKLKRWQFNLLIQYNLNQNSNEILFWELDNLIQKMTLKKSQKNSEKDKASFPY